MRVLYKDILTKSYSALKKAGATDNQIRKTLSKYYLKEGRQLIINESKGQTLSKALIDLKKGRVRQGVVIPKTAITNLKNDIKNLQKLNKYFGKDSFAGKLLNKYERGEMNAVALHNSMYSYVNNLAEYEDKAINNSNIEIIVDNFNPSFNPNAKPYTRIDVIDMYEK